jgi:hypothetical protein
LHILRGWQPDGNDRDYMGITRFFSR